jgi:hypothetical protein
MLSDESVREFPQLLKLPGHPLRFNSILMLLKRDHRVCEFLYVFEEHHLLSSEETQSSGLPGPYDRSNHTIYKLNEMVVPVIRKITGAVSC